MKYKKGDVVNKDKSGTIWRPGVEEPTLLAGTADLSESELMPLLSDEQCNEFRRLPCSFNDMVREIYKAGMNKTGCPEWDFNEKECMD